MFLFDVDFYWLYLSLSVFALHRVVKISRSRRNEGQAKKRKTDYNSVLHFRATFPITSISLDRFDLDSV